MADYSKIYAVMNQVEDSIVDRAMVQALPSAGPAARRQMVESLLDRGNMHGYIGLVENYHLLDAGLMTQICENVPKMEMAIRDAANGANDQTARNIDDMVIKSGAFEMIYLLAQMLPNISPTASSKSAKVILNVVLKLIGIKSDDPEVIHTIDRRIDQITDAIAEACLSYGRHRNEEIILAATLLLHRNNQKLISGMTDVRTNTEIAFDAKVRECNEDIIRKNLLLFALIPRFSQAVIDALNTKQKPEHILKIMNKTHLIAVPDVYTAVHRVGLYKDFLAMCENPDDHGPQFSRVILKWIATFRLNPQKRVAVLENFVESRDKLTRLLALRQLMKMQSELAAELIRGMVFDQDLHIARTALKHLLRRGEKALLGLRDVLDSSPHPQLRMFFPEQADGDAFEKLWDNWQSFDLNERMIQGRNVLRDDPLFMDRLTDQMKSEDVYSATRIIDIVRSVGLQMSFARQLIELSHSPHPKVAADAILCMQSAMSDEDVVDAVVEAMDHENDRVRSNAVEALEKADLANDYQTHIQLLAADSEGNRSRATAIRALFAMQDPQAAMCLRNLLKHEDHRFRISGLWVVSSLGLAQFDAELREVAKTDTKASTRIRALKVLLQLQEAANSKNKMSANRIQIGGGGS